MVRCDRVPAGIGFDGAGVLRSQPHWDSAQLPEREQGNPLPDQHVVAVVENEAFGGQHMEVEGMGQRVPPLGGGDESQQVCHGWGTDGSTPESPHVWVGGFDAVGEWVRPDDGPNDGPGGSGDAGRSARLWRGVRGDGRTIIGTDGTGHCIPHVQQISMFIIP